MILNLLDRYKDWHLNRQKNCEIIFKNFHTLEANINNLFNLFLEYIDYDITDFDYFYPEEFKKDFIKKGFDVEDFLLKISNNENYRMLIFENDLNKQKIKSVNFWKSDLPLNKAIGLLISYYNSHGILNKDSLKLCISDKLYYANLFDVDYIYWQNNQVLANYKYRKGLIYSKDKDGTKTVDITSRPGRKVYNKYFTYCGASKMWFGPMIYKFIPQELITSFVGAIEIKVLENNVTYVHLYDGIYDGDEPQNQEVQQRFRDHIGIDRLNID